MASAFPDFQAEHEQAWDRARAIMASAGILAEVDRLEELCAPNVADAMHAAPFDTAPGQEERRAGERFRAAEYRKGLRQIVFAVPGQDMRREIVQANRAIFRASLKEARWERDTARRRLAGHPATNQYAPLFIGGCAAVVTAFMWQIGGAGVGMSAMAFVVVSVLAELPRTLARYAREHDMLKVALDEAQHRIDAMAAGEIFSAYEAETGSNLEALAPSDS